MIINDDELQDDELLKYLINIIACALVRKFNFKPTFDADMKNDLCNKVF